MEGFFLIIWIITWSFSFFLQSESLDFLQNPQPSREFLSTWPGFFPAFVPFFFSPYVELLATKSFGQNAKHIRVCGTVACKCLKKKGNKHKLWHNLTTFWIVVLRGSNYENLYRFLFRWSWIPLVQPGGFCLNHSFFCGMKKTHLWLKKTAACSRILALRHAVAWWKISRFCRMRVLWGLWITNTRWLVERRVD